MENPSSQKTIMVVDDQKDILNLLSKILKIKKFPVLEASNAEDAIKKTNKTKETINLLITDINLPEMDGFELSEHLIQIHPEMKVLFISGNSLDMYGNLDKSIHKLNFLLKPFTIKQFTEKIQECFNQ